MMSRTQVRSAVLMSAAPKRIRHRDTLRRLICFRLISGEAWLVQVQARENRCAFLPDRVEGLWIQAKHLQDRGSHLSGFYKAVNGLRLGAGIRNQKHHIGVIPSETAVLGLLL